MDAEFGASMVYITNRDKAAHRRFSSTLARLLNLATSTRRARPAQRLADRVDGGHAARGAVQGAGAPQVHSAKLFKFTPIRSDSLGAIP